MSRQTSNSMFVETSVERESYRRSRIDAGMVLGSVAAGGQINVDRS